MRRQHLSSGAGAHLPMGGGIRIQLSLPMCGPRHGGTEWEEGSWLRSLPEQQKEWGSPRPPSLALLVIPVGTHGPCPEPWLWLAPHLPTQAPTGKRPCSLIGAPRLAGRASQITAAPHGSGSISWVSSIAREGWLLIKAAVLQAWGQNPPARACWGLVKAWERWRGRGTEGLGLGIGNGHMTTHLPGPGEAISGVPCGWMQGRGRCPAW